MPIDEVSELNKKFAECFIGVKSQSGLITPYKCAGVRYSDNPLIPQFTGYIWANNTGWAPLTFNGIESIIPHPQYGLINHNDYVLLAHRHPFRQWKGGITRQVVTVGVMNQVLVDYLNQKSGDKFHPIYNIEDGKFLTSLYNPKYYSFKDALESITSGNRIASAISSHIALSVYPFNKEIALFYKDYWIGEVIDHETIKIKPNMIPLKSELEQLSVNVNVD